MKPGIDYVGVSTPFYCHDGKGNFLLHKRSDKCRDEHFRWDPGGGKLERGLSVAENILKEIREEYGCDGVINEILPAHDIFRDNDGVKTHWLAVPGFVTVDPSEAKLNEPEFMLELGWFRLNALPEPLHRGFTHTFKIFVEHFKKYSPDI